jgi:tRNA(Arg) A34 adenosine deaminase TadA
VPDEPRNRRLKEYWDGPVKDLVALDEAPLEDGAKERHRLFGLLTFALLHHYFCGNKFGRGGTYPHNDPTDAADGPFLDADYVGHNIAALAVDGDGRIIDFEFNHNTMYRSSAEHAEARLVRRVYSLGQVHKAWNVSSAPPSRYTTFEDTTVYTSLESCAQCAGVMSLAKVRQVVYLQTDPGQFNVGNILRNLTKNTGLQGPRPISGEEIDFEYFARLDSAHAEFIESLQDDPFFVPDESWRSPSRSKSITSFLCTRVARAVFADAKEALEGLTASDLAHPGFVAPDHRGRIPDHAISNAEILDEIRDFLGYAIRAGSRATPHH